MNSHEVEYELYGDDMQFVEIELDPGEQVIGEAGAMMFLEPDITFESRMGDGSEPDAGMFGKLKSAGKRMITGESLFMTHYTNGGTQKRRLAFAGPFPGKIIPVDLNTVNGRLIAQKDSFLCAAMGTNLGIAFNKKLGAGMFGGEGFILQDIRGDGKAFLHAGGHVVEKVLTGETMRVDTGCLVAMEASIEYSIERAGNLKSMVFGGEGIFLTTLTGHGRVWLQSLPFVRLAARIHQNRPGGSSTQGEGSVLGGLSTMFESD